MNSTVDTFNEIIRKNIKYLIKLQKKYKYKIYLGDDNLEVVANRHKYEIKIVNKNELYWNLKPYNESFFETKVNMGYKDLDIIFFAIYENECLYRNRKKNINQ